jgi:hypothetical protein
MSGLRVVMVFALAATLASSLGCSSQSAKPLEFGPSRADSSQPEDATRTADAATTDARAPSVPGVLPFKDDFSHGYEANWQLANSGDGPALDTTDVDGNPIVSLDSTANDFSRLRCNMGGEKFSDVDVRASMRIRVDRVGDATRTIRLDVRQDSTSQNIFYAAGATVSSSDGSLTKVGIFKKVPTPNSSYTICALAQTKLATPIPLGAWATLEIRIRGSSTVHLEASLGETSAIYDDDCRSELTSTDGTGVPNQGCLAGQTAVGIQVEGGIKASVDDLWVESL